MEMASEIGASLNKLIMQKEEMIEFYNQEIKNLHETAHSHIEKICTDHEKIKLHLEAQKKEIENCERELQLHQDEEHNKFERQKIELEKIMNEGAIFEQTKADENIMHLAEDQKKEKRKFHKRIIELQRKLDAKQILELEIETMKGALQVMKHMEEDEDVEAQSKMKAIESDLKSKEEELDVMEKHFQKIKKKLWRTEFL